LARNIYELSLRGGEIHLIEAARCGIQPEWVYLYHEDDTVKAFYSISTILYVVEANKGAKVKKHVRKAAKRDGYLTK
jgi:hypothetical protein